MASVLQSPERVDEVYYSIVLFTKNKNFLLLVNRLGIMQR